MLTGSGGGVGGVGCSCGFDGDGSFVSFVSSAMASMMPEISVAVIG